MPQKAKLMLNTTSGAPGITVENVFNINYRNYLNRLRFFASEVGRISGFELNYTF